MNTRILFIGMIMLLLIFMVLGNAFQVQISRGQENLITSSVLGSQFEIVTAPRGLILDRYGRKLVINDPSFNMYVSPGFVDLDELSGTFTEIESRFGVPATELQSIFDRRAYNVSGELVGERITMIYNIDYNTFLENYQYLESVPGFFINSEPKRNYLYGNEFAHILGYLGDISTTEIKETGLDSRAQIGKDGLEKSFDNILRGQDGNSIAVKTNGNSIVNSSLAGENLQLTLDLNWQLVLYDALSKQVDSNSALGGSAIIVEADTGKVRSMVNYPSFDNNLFAEGISSADFQGLLENDQNPLLNRSIAMQIPTGSTFKAFMAAALLEEQAINVGTIYESGCFELPGDYVLCEADNRDYGRLNLTEALALSSNPYFCQAAVELARTSGSDVNAIRRLGEYFSEFGFGDRVDIDLPGAQPGTYPTPELKQRIQGESWFLADLCNTAIGQGLVSATPLQLALATSAFYNGGNVYDPILVEKIGGINQESSQLRSEVNVSNQNLEIVQNGMRRTVEVGTAKAFNSLPGDIHAKTGSSEATVLLQSGEILSGAHSWVLGKFEYGSETYIFVVALEFGGRGFRSLPVMEEFINCLYNDFSGCRSPNL